MWQELRPPPPQSLVYGLLCSPLAVLFFFFLFFFFFLTLFIVLLGVICTLLETTNNFSWILDSALQVYIVYQSLLKLIHNSLFIRMSKTLYAYPKTSVN